MSSVRNGSVGRKGHFISIGTGFRRHQPIMCREISSWSRKSRSGRVPFRRVSLLFLLSKLLNFNMEKGKKTHFNLRSKIPYSVLKLNC